MTEIGVGVCGTGWVAGEHIKSFQKLPGCRIAALYSRTEEGARAKASELGLKDVKIYARYEDMLADPSVNVVTICSPPNLHPEQTVLAAQAGKHMVIEKAVANDSAGLKAMLQAVETAKVKTVISFVLHWNPEFMLIKKMMDDKVLGDLFYAEVDYWHNIGPQYGQYMWNVKRDIAGSVWLSAGCHAVDAIRWFTGAEIVEVSAYSNRVNPAYEYDTNAVAAVKFSNGIIGKLSASFDCKCPYAFNIDLLGSQGSMRDNRIYAADHFTGQTDWMTVPTIRPDSGDVSHHPFDGQIAHFVNCVRNDDESPLNLADAAHTHAACFALERSAAEGRTVKIAEVNEEIW